MTQVTTGFDALGLSEALLKALADLNFQTPSPVQLQTIPYMLERRDLIGQAQTGTGKTAAFALPILQLLRPKERETQALVITPTRELAIQVGGHFKALAKYLPGIEIAVLCGGQDYGPQRKSLQNGAQIVVGTPGRVIDHIRRETLKLGKLSTFVLDEADEMLRMGFIEEVEAILAALPPAKQMALFSATMPTRIRQIANQYLKDPVSVEIRAETATVKSVEQRFIFASPPQKPHALLRVLAAEDTQGVIVFVRTKTSSEEVAQLLQQYGHHAMAIHGDLTQSLRERIIVQFKQGAINILVATDVAARGLDVDRVTHVINYDMAHDCETYVHRIGRTGRAGRSGVTILFVTPRESRFLNTIERHTRQRIEKMMVPNDFTIRTVRQKRFMDNITQRLQHEHVTSYRHMIENYINETNTAAVDVAAALALLLNQDKPWQETLVLPEVTAAPRTPKEDRGGRGGKQVNRAAEFANRGEKRFKTGYAEEIFRIEVGRVHGVKPGNIVGAIANEAGLQSRFITGLKIHDDHSTVRLPKDMPKEVVHGLTRAWVCGRQLKLTSLGSA